MRVSQERPVASPTADTASKRAVPGDRACHSFLLFSLFKLKPCCEERNETRHQQRLPFGSHTLIMKVDQQKLVNYVPNITYSFGLHL